MSDNGKNDEGMIEALTSGTIAKEMNIVANRANVHQFAERTSRRQLTPREREVLGQITSGASNKETGERLGISSRTVEVHRSRIMDKLNARNAADLVRIALTGHLEVN